MVLNENFHFAINFLDPNRKVIHIAYGITANKFY